jgi:hypothetical protein
VQLKDKGKFQSNFDEEDWYTKAFGAKRNLMKINFKVRFTTEIPKFENYAFQISLKYNMFPELAQEFKSHQFGTTVLCTLEKDGYYNENDQQDNVGEIELPFGTVELTVLFKNLTKENDPF